MDTAFFSKCKGFQKGAHEAAHIEENLLWLACNCCPLRSHKELTSIVSALSVTQEHKSYYYYFNTLVTWYL